MIFFTECLMRFSGNSNHLRKMTKCIKIKTMKVSEEKPGCKWSQSWQHGCGFHYPQTPDYTLFMESGTYWYIDFIYDAIATSRVFQTDRSLFGTMGSPHQVSYCQHGWSEWCEWRESRRLLTITTCESRFNISHHYLDDSWTALAVFFWKNMDREYLY